MADSLSRIYVDINYVNHDIEMEEEVADRLKNVMLSTGFYDNEDIELHNIVAPCKAKLDCAFLRELCKYTKVSNLKYLYGGDDDFRWKINKSYRANIGYVWLKRVQTQWDMFTKGLYEGRKLQLFRLTDSVLHILFETYCEIPDEYFIECLDLRNTEIIDIKEVLLADTSRTSIFNGAQVLANWIRSSGMYRSLRLILVSTEMKDSLKKYLKEAHLHQILVSDKPDPLEELFNLRIWDKSDINYKTALDRISKAKRYNKSQVTFDNLYLKPTKLSVVLQLCEGLEEIVTNGCHFQFNFQLPINDSLVGTKSIRIHSCMLEYLDETESQRLESKADKFSTDRAKFAEYLKTFGYKSA